MKTNLFFLTLFGVFLLWGCSQIDFDKNFVSPQFNQDKGKTNVNFNVGLTTAEAFVEILNKDTDGVLRKEVKEFTPIVQNGDTLLYLINYKDDKGWVIISGDKRTSGILGYDDKGSFELESLNPGQITWLDDLANQIYVLKKQANIEADTLAADFVLWNNIETLVANNEKRKSSAVPPVLPIIITDPEDLDELGHWDLLGITSQEISPTQVGPLIQTKWGQGLPWNTCVPNNVNTGKNCATGCVAVAGAQMLYYLHYLWNVPATMYSSGYCSGYVVSSNSYDYSFSFSNRTETAWDEMAKQINWGLDYQGKPIMILNNGTQLVSFLMGYIGWQVGMTYGEQSGAPLENLVGFFSSEGINSSCADFNSSTIVPSINNNLPVIVSAAATQNNHTFLGLFHLYYTYDDGHAWIIDGYQNKQIKYTYSYEWHPNVDPNPLLITPIYYKTEENIIATPNYFSMNWGWDSYSDSGWYAMGNNAVWTVVDYDKNNNPINVNYQYQKKMIVNFSKNC